MQLPESFFSFRRNFRFQHRDPTIGAEVSSYRGSYRMLQALQAFRVPSLRWVLFPVSRLWNGAAPQRRRLVRIAALVEREQSERLERSNLGIGLFRRNPGFEGIECNGKVRGGFRTIPILPRPSQPRHVDAARQAHRLQHPSIFGGQNAGPAAASFPCFRDESPRDPSLFGRRIQLQRKDRGDPRVDVVLLGLFPDARILLGGRTEAPVNVAKRFRDRQAVACPKGVDPE